MNLIEERTFTQIRVLIKNMYDVAFPESGSVKIKYNLKLFYGSID